MKKIISTHEAPAAIGPYSQATEAAGIVFVSGQIPVDPVSGFIPESVEDQTRRSLENVKAVLQEAKLLMKDVVKTTVFLTDLQNFQQVNNVYAEYFPNDAPARACVEVSALPKGALVEIEAIAVR